MKGGESCAAALLWRLCWVRRVCLRRLPPEISSELQVMLAWGAALVLCLYDFDTPETNARARDGAATLMWAGSIWWALGELLRTWLAARHLSATRPLERVMVRRGGWRACEAGGVNAMWVVLHSARRHFAP